MKTILEKNIIAVTVLLFVGVLSSCKNEELEIYEYPEHTVTDFSPRSGRPGSQVVITGTDFGTLPGAVSVEFNGLKVEEVDSVSDNRIFVRVPEDATTGPLKVNVWTHSKVTTENFEFIPGGKIAAITPLEGEAGQQLTIEGENFGTDANDISVYFKDNVQAEIVSVAPDKIVVTVPEGGTTGPITVEIGQQLITGPVFNYPLNGIEFLFNTEGDTEAWVTTHNSTNEVKFDVMKVSFDMSAAKRRADFSHTGGITVHAGAYPIVAIRMIDKPASGNLILDTNLGRYKDGSNNWEGVLDGDVYYYDLRNSFGAGNTLSQTQETTLTTFQWKVADITTNETGYFVDWVKSFTSVEELETYVAEQNIGQNYYGFTGPERAVTLDVMDDWIGRDNQPGTTTVIENGYAKVSFTPSDGSTKARADFNWSQGGNWGALDKEPWHYHPDFPIYAIKIHFVQPDGSLGGPRPATGTVRYDRLGNFDDTYANSHNVLWVDATSWSAAEKLEGSWWAVVIADILSSEQGYWVDWHRTFRSVEEMEFYLN